MTQVFYARSDVAKGRDGKLNLPKEAAVVELVFQDLAKTPTNGLPDEDQRVMVDGVERYYWLEQVGRLMPRRDLRAVEGHDLRRKPVRVITTDDGRRYAFLDDPILDRAVVEAIPPGGRRIKAAL